MLIDCYHSIRLGGLGDLICRRMPCRSLGQKTACFGQLPMLAKNYSSSSLMTGCMACMSGGKNSHAMLAPLRLIQHGVPFSFPIVAVNPDLGHPDFPRHALELHLKDSGDDYRMITEDTHPIVMEGIPMGKTFCEPPRRSGSGAAESERPARRALRLEHPISGDGGGRGRLCAPP